VKIILARPRGFCAGVNMAVEALETAIDRFGTPLFVYHEIVHNRHIVDRFRLRGVIFVDKLDDVPAGGRVMYSAHGVSPEVEKEAQLRNLKIIDATCPLVRKVHWQAARFAQLGYTIVLVGHRGHDEVAGVMGVAPQQMILVETAADVDRLQISNRNVAYLTQTTLSVDEANVIVGRLKQRFPQCVGSPKEDICYATQNRQEALKAILADVELVLVVGSQNSSNSNRLSEIAGQYGVPAYLIDGPTDIDLQWFQGVKVAAVTAGASAPEDLVDACLQLLNREFGVEIEERSTLEEHVFFPLPSGLREIGAPPQALSLAH
jgi:4-hydroxy-3-methylbut-2-en-1-yl diphosphate reductase